MLRKQKLFIIVFSKLLRKKKYKIYLSVCIFNKNIEYILNTDFIVKNRNKYK